MWHPQLVGWQEWVWFFLVIFLSILLGKLFYFISSKIIRRLTKYTKTNLDDILVKHLEKPAIFLIFILGFYYAYSAMDFSPELLGYFNTALKIMVISLIAWVVINLIDAFIEHYAQPLAARTQSDLDDQLIPIFRKIIKIILVIITAILIISTFGVNVSSLVAGVGIGGLALALAAQDLLSNLFGGFAILSDKPFKVGDRIKLDDRTEGVVKKISTRSTTIETFGGTEIVMPNSKVANTILENISREKNRRMVLKLSIEYTTPNEKLEKACDLIREIIKKQKYTTDEVTVFFENFGESELKFTVIYWIKDLSKYAETVHEVNMAIKRRLEKENIRFAFPTRIVHVKK